MMILFVMAILPVILLGSFIYANDKIEKEPAWMLVTLGLSGIGAVIITLIITAIGEKIFPLLALEPTEITDYLDLAIYVFFGIAIIEEFSKWIFTFLISWFSKEFNHIYDAIVYCVFVSLGFAGIENVLYVLSNYAAAGVFGGIIVAILRMIMSVPGHAFFAVFMGFFLGKAKKAQLEHKSPILYILLSIIVPAFIHFVFDFTLMANLVLLTFILVTVLYIVCIIIVRKVGRVNSMLPGFMFPRIYGPQVYQGYQYQGQVAFTNNGYYNYPQQAYSNQYQNTNYQQPIYNNGYQNTNYEQPTYNNVNQNINYQQQYNGMNNYNQSYPSYNEQTNNTVPTNPSNNINNNQTFGYPSTNQNNQFYQ